MKLKLIELFIISLAVAFSLAVVFFFILPVKFDWFAWSMGLLQGTIVGVLSGVVLLFVIFPRISVKTGKATLKAMKDDDDIKHMITTVKDVMAAAKPFLDAVKQIKPEDIDALVKALKSFTTGEKHELPPLLPEDKHEEDCINPADCPRKDEDCLNFPEGKCLKIPRKENGESKNEV